jgi:hypothetical protein
MEHDGWMARYRYCPVLSLDGGWERTACHTGLWTGEKWGQTALSTRRR